MSSNSFNQSMRRLWALDKFSYSVRVFIALTGSMALCWYQDEMTLLIPLFLGIIASALAETDDSWQGRLNALAVTLVCFSIAALSVELLFPYPWLFAIALALASFCLTMLGALGERYGAIASATLILSVYTMIGVDQRGGAVSDFWHEPLLLVAGAAWYGALSVLWQVLFSNQPVQQSLARLFRELGRYLKLKSSLFEPIRQLDVEARRLELAQQNGRVVAALNAAKEIILHRVGNGRPGSKVSRYLKLYFLAQDIHERASSSHYPYNALADAFFHSDVLFRCQRLLRQQGKACEALAESIQLRQPFVYDASFAEALSDLNASMEHLRVQSNPAWRGLLRSLRALAANLSTLDRLLGDASNPDALADATDSNLLDRAPRNFKEMWTRLRTQLTPTSLLFRHALRLALALTIGYGTLHAIHASQGYWIILTTLFVCQPNYGATRRKLGQRIIGTAIGLTVAWALFDLFPSPLVQSMFAIAAGLVFFIYRTTRYTLATAAITLMVLFCFNQVGDGYGLFLPRLFDTLIGSLIAGLTVFLFLPDWQGRRLNKVLANTLTCNSIYLRQIMQQYAAGKRDDLAYRLARRNAHNADAALSTTLANMLMEPGHFRKEADVGFRFLVLSHTLLSYLSGLGAHRGTQLPAEVREHLIDEAGNSLAASIDEIATGLANKQPIAIQSDAEETLATDLEQMPDEIDEGQRLVQTQLALICRQLGPLRTLAAHLIKDTEAT
ncbi:MULTISPECIES: YccS family putative transporter [Pseudomonas]|uniref:TIGR01666 family membrane protein n=1 Tax=Pseudomonas extremaustralis TaxID=359110 RepID=A0A5C5QJB6_9PSED|nr:YccS family putative transporter [Pseudomonas extremaustralis]EZI27003.1 YccS/YhfK family integral membrane protein [Pseudomonas extremaustralis 14-3 substr. 14-3b]MDB1107981.1 YccS family putative transporter [Pseudomonas extremaustralis]MDF3135597.1 YccS family putative transporter [Pseudomonas extremaustralis]TWS05405.1 TIGR01666 family membrane protein [Pseudomonas extremaustralis]SDG13260.1 TIGR01666 family membrane protein [Pseudomonas extremaustralis]